MCILFQELLFDYIFWNHAQVNYLVIIQFVMVTVTHFILQCNHSWGISFELDSNICKLKYPQVYLHEGYTDSLLLRLLDIWKHNLLPAVLSVPPRLLDVGPLFSLAS